MSKTHVTTPERPSKPYPDYPLFAHTNGQWAKKIRGTIHYFGKWTADTSTTPDRGADAALEKYLAEKDDLHAGRTPRPTVQGMTVRDVANAYLNMKADARDAGELSPRTWLEAKEATDLIVSQFGRSRLVSDLRPDDFERLRSAMAKRWGPVRLGNVVHRIKSVFKYALESGLLEKPVIYGPTYRKPSAGVLRRHRAKNGERMLDAEQLRKLLEHLEPNPQLRAMVLLGLNCGFGNTDVATLPLTAVDLDGATIDFPRPKTGIGRRCKLWPETIEALRAVIESRPKKDSEIVFLNSRGTPWIRLTPSFRSDSLSRVFKESLQAIGEHRPGIGFYSLRHVFRTIADAARDPVAFDLIMGHSDPSMGARYRERIDDARLQAVTDHVRTWLFGGSPAGIPPSVDAMAS